jgi:hypothetical protein
MNDTEKNKASNTRRYTCRKCSVEGHNARTCGFPTREHAIAHANAAWLLKSEAAARRAFANKQPKRYYACSICSEVGHNRTTCPAKNRTYKCGKCSEVGHNRTTCPAKNRTYKCGKCGVEGHNKRGCTAVISVSGKIITPHNFTAARGYRCGNCGMDGHSRRNCPRRKHDY